MSRFVFGLMSILLVSSAAGETTNPVAEVFQAEGIAGTFVVASSDGKLVHVFNDKRAVTRFSPASTFKILNTLIALDTGVVTSKESAFSWDGIDRGVPAWNKDQTLESAFRVSCVWCYQEIAREVGSDEYMIALARNEYGNEQVGDQVDQFWLNGVLQISAIEQVEFLKKLNDYSLPYRRDHIDIVKEIMLEEKADDYSIHGKTGWTGAERHIGWYVGYVVKGDQTWLFAMNMRMDRAEQAPMRKALAVRSLKALGIL